MFLSVFPGKLFLIRLDLEQKASGG
jgi:hypothetical protein